MKKVRLQLNFFCGGEKRKKNDFILIHIKLNIVDSRISQKMLPYIVYNIVQYNKQNKNDMIKKKEM